MIYHNWMMRMNFWNISHFISRAAYLASQVCERKVGHFSEQWRFAWCLTSSKTSNGLSRHKKDDNTEEKYKKNFMVSNIFLATVVQISESYKSTFMNVLHQETLCVFQIQVWWKCKCWKMHLFPALVYLQFDIFTLQPAHHFIHQELVLCSVRPH